MTIWNTYFGMLQAFPRTVVVVDLFKRKLQRLLFQKRIYVMGGMFKSRTEPLVCLSPFTVITWIKSD